MVEEEGHRFLSAVDAEVAACHEARVELSTEVGEALHETGVTKLWHLEVHRVVALTGDQPEPAMP